MTQKIWFITGISSGLGKALAQSVIEKGDFVIGTFRQQQQVDEFNRAYSKQAFAYLLDICNEEQVKASIENIYAQFKKIDVLVNNAGFGFAGAIEEASMAEVRTVMEANFFATLHITQLVLPYMRTQKSGHIIQISSQAGIRATPGFGIYNASKFALEGFSEALAQEIAPLNIALSIVEPGPFRTNFAAGSFKQAANTIADYAETAGAFRARMDQINGKQEGDPAKAALAIIELVNKENPPLRVPLGKIAIQALTAKIASVQKDLDAGRETAENAIF